MDLLWEAHELYAPAPEPSEPLRHEQLHVGHG